MPKHSLLQTNSYLRNPIKRHQMFLMTVCTSTGIDGVKLERSDLEDEYPRLRPSKPAKPLHLSMDL